MRTEASDEEIAYADLVLGSAFDATINEATKDFGVIGRLLACSSLQEPCMKTVQPTSLTGSGVETRRKNGWTS